jgi:hypothetical protein
MLGSFLGPDLLSEGRNAIFSGPSGSGKTHLGIAIEYRAIQHGYEARFAGADALIAELSRAATRGRLALALEPYVHPPVLVLDELGYLYHAPDVLYPRGERTLPPAAARPVDDEQTAGGPGRRVA